MTIDEIKTLKWWLDNKGPIYYFENDKYFLVDFIVSYNEFAVFNDPEKSDLWLADCNLSDFGQISKFN